MGHPMTKDGKPDWRYKKNYDSAFSLTKNSRFFWEK